MVNETGKVALWRNIGFVARYADKFSYLKYYTHMLRVLLNDSE